MNTNSPKLPILIVGATGALGSLLTKHCLTKPNLLVNILVRNPQKNKELTESVKKSGGKVFQADVTEPSTFKGITKGIHTVIFTLPRSDEKASVDGQIAMIDDCVANGVQRIVPASFSFNFSKFSEEEMAHSRVALGKKKVKEHLKSLPVKTLIVDAGGFVETVLQLVLDKNFSCWGNAEKKMQMTSYEDVARFTACAIAREDMFGHYVVVAHDLSINQFATIYNKVRGTQMVPKSLGTLEDLKAKAEELEKEGNEEAIVKRLLCYFYDDRSRFDKVDNSEFLEVEVTPLEETLKQRPDLLL